MFKRLHLFTPPDDPVLSLSVQARMDGNKPVKSRFEVLVRHLLDRFLNNELMSSDEETTHTAQLTYAIALPGLVVALILYPAYHPFFSPSGHRAFWPQAGDHYFYVMYPLVVMGLVTVYEWDLLFPDLLDVFVLSVLPIANRRLFLARVLAIVIFLALIMLGVNSLGAVFLPLVAELPNPARHFMAHLLAVTASGTFSAAFFLALQGALLNVVGERVFRRITPLLQAVSVTVLLAVLFIFPLISGSLTLLLASDIPSVRFFPPFWFLGLYEWLLLGSAAPSIFASLARTGCWALLLVISSTLITYPLAYRRRVRQLIEGPGASNVKSWATSPLNKLLHATVFRLPVQRAIVHFISQTLMRTQRHRVLLAMYTGLGAALTLADIVTLNLNQGHASIGFLPYGVRAAIPTIAFWTVAGLQAALAAPVDLRGSWIFRVILGPPHLGSLGSARVWVAFCGCVTSVAAVGVLRLLAPAALPGPLAMAGQFIVAVGVSVLLTDLLFFSRKALPFTERRRAAFTDVPLAFIKYIVLFPQLVAIVVHCEIWIEASVWHLVKTVFMVSGMHVAIQAIYRRALSESSDVNEAADADLFPQRLGLQE